MIALTLLGSAAACSASPIATDTVPRSVETARQLARTVASNGGCGGFEDYNFNRSADTWVFTCQTPGASFEIVAYGSQSARSEGLKTLDNSGNTYIARNFYAVAVVGSYGNSSADSALAPFSK